MRILTLLTVLLFPAYLLAQSAFLPSPVYRQLASQATGLYASKQYRAAGERFEQAFAQQKGKSLLPDRYNAACSWALAGHKDKAFAHLRVAVDQLGFAALSHLLQDTDLKGLHADPRWQGVVEKTRANQLKERRTQDTALVAMLDTIYMEDQQIRLEIDSLMRRYGWESSQVQVLLPRMRELDSLNLEKVKGLLDTRGWLGAQQIGRQGNQTLFLVIQHADSATQEKYLPMMREAVKKGAAEASQLALLEDRTRMNRGEKQLYGSQVRSKPGSTELELWPVEDEVNVNKRRAAVGLEPLEEYLKHFGIEYRVRKGARR